MDLFVRPKFSQKTQDRLTTQPWEHLLKFAKPTTTIIAGFDMPKQQRFVRFAIQPAPTSVDARLPDK